MQDPWALGRRLLPEGVTASGPAALPSLAVNRCLIPILKGNFQPLTQFWPLTHCLQPPAEPQMLPGCSVWSSVPAQNDVFPMFRHVSSASSGTRPFDDGQVTWPVLTPQVFGVPGSVSALCVPGKRLLCIIQVSWVVQGSPPHKSRLAGVKITLKSFLMSSSTGLVVEPAVLKALLFCPTALNHCSWPVIIKLGVCNFFLSFNYILQEENCPLHS